jgi:hypothetical protein
MNEEELTTEQEALVVREFYFAGNSPEEVLEKVSAAARLLRELRAKNPSKVVIGGKPYDGFDVLQTTGTLLGVTSTVRHTSFVKYGDVSGIEAVADVVTSSGRVISSAVSMCLTDEERWSGRPLFQVSSMAQTRACRKALRNVLAWVVTLAGFEKELNEDSEDERPHSPKSEDALRQRLLAHAAQLLANVSLEKRKAALGRLLKLQTDEMCERVAELAARPAPNAALVQDQVGSEDDTQE